MDQWYDSVTGFAPLAGHATGPRYVYVNRRAPAGATAYPAGTVIVKTIETGHLAMIEDPEGLARLLLEEV